MSPEVIDLTSSPAPEYIVIDSDGDDNSSVIRLPKQKAKRQHSKSSLLDRMTGAHGERLRENSGEISNSGGDAKPKRRKKKKKKVAVVVDGAPEVEDENEEGEVKSDEVGNGREGKGNDEEEVGEIPQAVPSLLDRLSGVERPPKPTSAKRKNSDPGHGAEPTSERSSKKRKRKESGKENDGDSGGQKPRSPSPERKREGPSSSTAEELFFVDLTPAEIPVTVKIPMNSTRPSTQTSGSAAVEEVVQKLLLPAHVSLLENVNGVEPVEISDPTPQDTDEESYIDYLDYGDNDLKGLGPRYFEDPEEHAEGSESKRRLVCKKCGVEGQHVARDCHVIICLTCGVRDEHPTRNCPISKVCFTCGMKGHTRNNCPNRYRHNSVSKYDDCDRCGSSIHQAKECPTLWRMYEYVDDRQRQKILSSREEKANLAIGEGGEGYIGRDEWCYNCGESGHLGDDCEVIPHPRDFPRESSAFGIYNIGAGPFFDPSIEEKRPPQKPKKTYREEAEEMWGDGHGFVLPMDVGKEGRRKEKERLAKKARETQVDDEEDWFNGGGSGRPKPASGRNNGPTNGRQPGNSGGNGKGPPSGPSKKFSFGNISKDESRFADTRGSDRRYQDDFSRPSRETDSIQIKGAAKREKERDRPRYSDDRSSGSRKYPGDDRRDDRRGGSRGGGDSWRDRPTHEDNYHNRGYPRDRRDRGSGPGESKNAPRYRGGYR